MKYIVANLKSSMSNDDKKAYIKDINKNLIRDKRVIIAPSFIYLNDFLETGFSLAAQNVFEEAGSDYTGVVTAAQLKDLRVGYTFIGYSDARINFREDNQILLKKVKQALKNNLKIIYCVGETAEQRTMKKTFNVVKEQLKNILSLNAEYLVDIFIAYEPVWAIGQGVTPTIEEITEMMIYIKNLFKNEKIKVLYGGSVNRNNIQILNTIKDLDGFVVGKATYNSENLISLVDAIYNE